MKQFVIENVQVGVSKGGSACGPVGGHVIAEVRVRNVEDGVITYHSLAEIENSLSFTLSNESTYDGQIEEDYDDTEFWDKISAGENGSYNDYNEFYNDLENHENCDEDRSLIWRYLAYMVRADWDEVDRMKANSIGKILGTFEIPVCDAEKEFLDIKEE